MTKRSKLPTPPELAEHARALARAFQVELVEDIKLCVKPEHAVSVTCNTPLGLLQMVSTQPIVDETSYAIALHEIGHCVAPLGNAKGLDTLTKERAAWEWARHYSLDWTVAMEHVATLSLNSYLEVERRQKVQEVRNTVQDQKRQKDLKSWLRKVKV